MNTAQPRWRVLAPTENDAVLEQLMVALYGHPIEAVVEGVGAAEIYFADYRDALRCAAELGLDPPTQSSSGSGAVFGQTMHPTTELCLALIPPAARRVADIGSGTGRLAAEAAKRAAELVVAVDPDLPAALATRQTLAPLPNTLALQASANALATAAFDLVLANLHLSLWRQLAPEIARIAAPNATLVASGFLAEQQDEAASLVTSTGWQLESTRADSGWLALRARRIR